MRHYPVPDRPPAVFLLFAFFPTALELSQQLSVVYQVILSVSFSLYEVSVRVQVLDPCPVYCTVTVDYHRVCEK